MMKKNFASNTLEGVWLYALRNIIAYGNNVEEFEPFLEIRNLQVSYKNAFEVDSKNYSKLFGNQFFDYMHKVYSPDGDINTGRNYYNLIYKQSGIDQVARILEELKINPLSRSATIILANPEVMKKPCVTEVNFSIRQGLLHMSVIFKSSDFAKKFIPDMVELSQIHKNISYNLHIPRGEVNAIIFTAQVYKQDIGLINKEIQKLKKSRYFKTEDVIQNWDQEAEKWDYNVNNPTHYVNFEDGYSRFLHFMDNEIPTVTKKLNALDSGCGTGIIADVLNKKGYDVVGIDISPKMLLFAHKNEYARQYILANSLDIPYDDNYFDMICSRGVLISHVGKKYTEIFLREHRRVLKFGGIFMFDFITKFKESESNKKKKKAYMSFEKISKILKKNGFEVLKRSGDNINRINAITCQKI